MDNPLLAFPPPSHVRPLVQPKLALQAPPTYVGLAVLGIVLGAAYWIVSERAAALKTAQGEAVLKDVKAVVQPGMLGNTELAPESKAL